MKALITDRKLCVCFGFQQFFSFLQTTILELACDYIRRFFSVEVVFHISSDFFSFYLVMLFRYFLASFLQRCLRLFVCLGFLHFGKNGQAAPIALHEIPNASLLYKMHAVVGLVAGRKYHILIGYSQDLPIFYFFSSPGR